MTGERRVVRGTAEAGAAEQRRGQRAVQPGDSDRPGILDEACGERRAARMEPVGGVDDQHAGLHEPVRRHAVRAEPFPRGLGEHR
ncbi:hypothetical protein [Micromonospora sp. NPDC023814]|uniref:hypothetical protein n=1 Tax=Micromonospora sp. NPDC023814 TaxID=3154596 RepID=UPI0033CC9F2F